MSKPDALALADRIEVELGDPSPLSGSTAVEAAAELRRLHAENEALRKDAERYRWLKQQFRVMSLDMGGQHTWVLARSGSLRGYDMDSATDAGILRSELTAAAMKEQA